MSMVVVIREDIAALDVDAVVHAANPALAACEGSEHRLYQAAGPELIEACRRLGGCDCGDAKITPGFGLPARYVIHAVAPAWHGGGAREEHLLELCYRRSLELAAGSELRSVAFPCIGAGIYGFPNGRAAEIATETVAEFIRAHPFLLDRVLFGLPDGELADVYERLLSVGMAS